MILLRYTFFIFSFYLPIFANANQILSASNIENGKAIFVIQTEDKKNPRQLIELELFNAKKTTLDWPKDVQQEEVMGLIQLKEQILLIAQWTAGGGKYPHIYQYQFAKKEWSLIGELTCASFDKIKVEQSTLTVDCEENYLKSKPAGPQTLKLPVSSRVSYKATLPIESDKNQKFGFKLMGELFHWKYLEVTTAKSKTQKIYF